MALSGDEVFGLLNKKIKGVASGFDYVTKTGDNTFDIYFKNGSKVSITIPGMTTSEIEAIVKNMEQVKVMDRVPSLADKGDFFIVDDGEAEEAEEYLTKGETEDYISEKVESLKSEFITPSEVDTKIADAIGGAMNGRY